ncbi:hypothetical protein [Cupriavidus malaysiensis]|uniref:Uncharacterized protein n=1 Tax=Cupriavidus malaysiensis TaxID=367825 RepID=A0ABN4TK09_9BURK|nr:hypothetical protein [Cupriavidus malaysiensis]AOZ06746.1 hypothetical protein BKK80_13655 [Cupriavidus malaysiensis]
MAGILGWIEAHPALAGWVQAVASVAAIWWAGHTSVRLQRSDRQHARKTLGEAVQKIAEAARDTAGHVIKEIPDRQAVYDIAQGNKHFDQQVLVQIDRSVSGIPLHELNTANLVTFVIMLGSLTRQLKEQVAAALEFHREMDAAQFEAFFKALKQMRTAIEDIRGKIETEVKNIH